MLETTVHGDIEYSNNLNQTYKRIKLLWEKTTVIFKILVRNRSPPTRHFHSTVCFVYTFSFLAHKFSSVTAFIYLLFIATVWQGSAKLKCYLDGTHILVSKDCRRATSFFKQSQYCALWGSLPSIQLRLWKWSHWGLDLGTWQPEGRKRSSPHKDLIYSIHNTFSSGHLHISRFTRSLWERSCVKASSK